MFLKDFKYYILCFSLFVACKKEKNYDPVHISEGVVFQTITDLPGILEESSGIELVDSGNILSINDSKGEAELYAVDLNGNLTRTIKISNATNTDWEDLAQDEAGNIFIGDMGNNDNDRKDLKIYKIPNPNSNTENEISASEIKFSFMTF